MPDLFICSVILIFFPFACSFRGDLCGPRLETWDGFVSECVGSCCLSPQGDISSFYLLDSFIFLACQGKLVANYWEGIFVSGIHCFFKSFLWRLLWWRRWRGFPKSPRGGQPVCEALVQLPGCSPLLPTNAPAVPFSPRGSLGSPGLGGLFHPRTSHRVFPCQCWTVLVSTLTHLFSPAPNHVYFLHVSSPLRPFFLRSRGCHRLFFLLSVPFSGVWEERGIKHVSSNCHLQVSLVTLSSLFIRRV